MNDRPLKILLFCDASNLHRCLAEGLRRKGHEVVVASDGNRWMDTERDIDLSRPFDNKIGGALLWHKTKRLLKDKLSGYDIVSVSNATFPFLRPHRMQYILKELARNNKNVFVNALGSDSFYVEKCLDKNLQLRYTEWMCNGELTQYARENESNINKWLGPELKLLYTNLYNVCRGATSVMYEYDLVCRQFLDLSHIGYTGIPIDTISIKPFELPDRPKKVKLFLGMHSNRKVEKGTDRILTAAQRVLAKYPDKCDLEIIENVPYKEYIERLKNGHVVLDQLYSYAPATNALLAMAMGLNTLSGGEKEYYDFIGEKNMHPIINAIPDDEALFNTIEDVVLHPELIRKRGLQSREFVEKHNSVGVVAERYLNFWQSRMNKDLIKLKI